MQAIDFMVTPAEGRESHKINEFGGEKSNFAAMGNQGLSGKGSNRKRRPPDPERAKAAISAKITTFQYKKAGLLSRKTYLTDRAVASALSHH